MNNPHVLITGSNGLVASQFIHQFGSIFDFDTLDVSNPKSPIDITNLEQVLTALSKSGAQSLIHCAAYTNVTEAWKQQDDKKGPAYQVNVVGTQNILEACLQTNKHLIHISTPYIFDGSSEDLYTEEAEPTPIEWYGFTKSEAERLIRESSINWTIFRIDQPFRSLPFTRSDTVRRIIKGLVDNSLPPQFTDHTFGPTFLDDFSEVLKWAVEEQPQGIFHASSGEKWNDYDFALLVKEMYKLPGTVTSGSLQDYLAQSNRPYQKNTAMNTNKLSRAFKKQKSIREAVAICASSNT